MRGILALAVLLVLAGCLGGGPGADAPTLEERWTAGGSSVQGNHHAIAAGRVEGEAVIAAPVGGRQGEGGCALLVFDGTGSERWRDTIAPEACTIHAVADPTLADYDGDGTVELLAATTEKELVAYDALTGDEEFTFPLSNYGYTKPVVADVTGDGVNEIVVTDIDGTLYVVNETGKLWNRSLDAFSWSAPAVADFTGDERPEIVLGIGNGTALAFDAAGERLWRTETDGGVTWTAHGDLDGDGAPEFVVATEAGAVQAFDGDGSLLWERSLGRLAAVGAVVDADGDGTAEVYATARDATLRALDGPSGETEWETTLTSEAVQMTPPPVVGDVTGDGEPEIVATTNNGRALVVSPSGEIRGVYERDASIYTHATLGDTDGDGVAEVYLMYGDGKVVAIATEKV
ncbi:FG-GAP-like repeat-containing protein [Natronomonas sp. EA1]|uniref:FG-GAP-like repeat-containing protein n=1 Tax=Natronomonas sp. EA1 TaxID=3421655 RepID=UPI003EBE33DE